MIPCDGCPERSELTSHGATVSAMSSGVPRRRRICAAVEVAAAAISAGTGPPRSRDLQPRLAAHEWRLTAVEQCPDLLADHQRSALSGLRARAGDVRREHDLVELE